MKHMTQLIILLAAIFLISCASTPQESLVQAQAFDYDNLPQREVFNGAIFDRVNGNSLFADRKARMPGDIVTVLLVEQTSGQNSSDSNLSQSTSANVSAPTFGGSTRDNMQIDLTSGHTFSGDADSSQSNQLNGSISVTVHEVLPGGNLLVEGEKWIQINQNREHISLSGIIRINDIGFNNTVMSTQVANARIAYAGVGTGKQMSKPGWAARIVFSSLWPF